MNYYCMLSFCASLLFSSLFCLWLLVYVRCLPVVRLLLDPLVGRQHVRVGQRVAGLAEVFLCYRLFIVVL